MKRHDEYRDTPVKDLSDTALLFDKRQAEINIQCGTSNDHHRALEWRIREINIELATRRESEESAEQRAELARINASPLARLWALIDAGSEGSVDVMTTDEHYREAIKLARHVITIDDDLLAKVGATSAKPIANALLEMEDQLAQARGLLVSITRSARKWRDIARGESLNMAHLSQDELGLLVGMCRAHCMEADTEPALRGLYKTICAAKK